MIHDKTFKKDITRLEPSERISNLKDELLQAPHTFSYEIAYLAKQSYEETKIQPMILRRAHAFSKIMHEMTIYIRPLELIVGNRSEKLGALPKVPQEPDFDSKDPRSSGHTDQYEGQWLYTEFLAQLSEEAKNAQAELLAGYPAGSAGGYGHIIGDYEVILKKGALELADEALRQRDKFPPSMKKQRDFCEAAAVSCRALAAWGFRYAQLAKKMAETCEDPVRISELREIAEICSKVPAYPAQSFREALQSLWLTHQAFTIEQPAGSISLSGLDQYLNEYLIQDLKQNNLSMEEAALLVENLFVKFMENAIWPREIQLFPHISLGGQDVEGNDRTNDVSCLFLESMMKLKSCQPLLSVRWHPQIDQHFWNNAVACLKAGLGMPAFFSDEPMVKSLISWGIPREEAMEYGVVGCVEPAIRGKLHGQTLGGHVNLAKCLELALNDGRSVTTARQLGPHTGRLIDFKTMADVWKAYQSQVETACRLNVEAVHIVSKVQRELYGYPLLSATMAGSIENGRDLAEGVKYNMPTVCITGITNVVDAFLILEDLVFDRKIIALDDLYRALQENYAGKEHLKHLLQTYPVRFGSGDARASDMFNKICSVHQKALCNYPGPVGGNFTSGVWPVTWHIYQGQKTAATPDGRGDGEPLVDGVGPAKSSLKPSPTDIARNVASIEAEQYWPGGYTFNMRFSSMLFRESNLSSKIAQYIETYFQLGGMQIQINTVGREVLLNAKKQPELYKDLVVRVAGFSAYFTALSQEVQDEIISRAEQTL